ncbi:hypothetical protein Val02_23370 [Virgisporangium aliadipatigenens]|uniref:Uncharacterized protein n=1 Tax=Virgisporangium aliadipatigenens TaxID=741659 RepID=A0A8J3YI06_9ACTN|nr:hypothetical protein [Virgisporangium aliadipatigenens]GIJ45451.1 hypothetical protein Val02_23370 [Virgisporangium aliadipatigenens]
MASATGVEADRQADPLAQVRRLLRHREYRRAVEMIDRRLIGVVAVDTRFPLEDLKTYAYERLSRFGPGPSWRTPVSLRRGNPVSLRRPVTVDLRRLDRAELEQVLRWLLAGEIRAADEALRAGDWTGVVTAAEFAGRIDDRSTRIAAAHARGLYELAVDALDRESPDLDDVLGQLQRAARLAARAGTDPSLGAGPKKLTAGIEEVAAIVERRRARAARVEAVRSVVRRFNRLTEHYADRDQLISHVQLGNARASLAQIRGDVERLLPQHEPDSPASRMLADLRVKIDQYKIQLERIGRTLRAE